MWGFRGLGLGFGGLGFGDLGLTGVAPTCYYGMCKRVRRIGGGYPHIHVDYDALAQPVVKCKHHRVQRARCLHCEDAVDTQNPA